MSIEHLGDSTDSSVLHDLDGFCAANPSKADPPSEFMDQATQLLTTHQDPEVKSLGIDTVVALAGLLLQLYTYFKDHPAARKMMARATIHPHGFAAQLVHHKVESELPPKLQGIKDLPASIILVTDAALTKLGV